MSDLAPPGSSTTRRPQRLPAAATALGVALLSAAMAMSAFYSRISAELDRSNFAMGCASAATLLLFATSARALLPPGPTRLALSSWPGAAGAVGTGALVIVAVNSGGWGPYAGGAVVLALSAAGYALVGTAPYALTGFGGIAAVYLWVVGDAWASQSEDNRFLVLGVALTLLVFGLTAMAALLPRDNSLITLTVGVGGLLGLALLFQGVTISRTIAVAGFGGPPPELESGFESGIESGIVESGPGSTGFGPFAGPFANPYVNDVYVLLGCSAAMMALWFACSLRTGQAGFRVLILAAAVVSIPAAAMALIINHPTWWEVACAGAGGIVLATVAVLPWLGAENPVEDPPAAR